MEFYEIQDPLQCNTIDVYDDYIQKGNRLSNVILTREDLVQHLSQLRAENKIERLLELEETWSAILRVNDRVKANYAQGLVNGEKIVNLEEKVEGVYQKVEELDDKVGNLSKKCQSLKQRMMKEIPKITEKEIMERTESTQLSPNVSNGSSIITLELADLCANSVVIDYANFKENNIKKSNSVSRKDSSKQENTWFYCEICGRGYHLKKSLYEHKRRKHSLMSRGSGENRPQVENGFWCTHCNKKFVHAQRYAKHESGCVEKTKPSATASATKDISKVQESGKNIRKSKRFCEKKEPEKTRSVDFFSCPFCHYWAYRSTTLVRHVEKFHRAQ